MHITGIIFLDEQDIEYLVIINRATVYFYIPFTMTCTLIRKSTGNPIRVFYKTLSLPFFKLFFTFFAVGY